jgi:hypothetical protein
MRGLAEQLKLEFNEKTQIFPIANGVNYLGFHIYLTESGKVLRLIRPAAKTRFRRGLKQMSADYDAGRVDQEQIQRRMSGYLGHFQHGHTFRLCRHLIGKVPTIVSVIQQEFKKVKGKEKDE